MEIQTHANTIPLSATKAIDVGKIEKELAAMWRASSGGEASADSGVTRACALNLIVYTTMEDDRAQIDEMLEEVNAQHPGRSLVLVADRETSEARLEAYVSSRCRALGGSKVQVCGEQVTIEAGGAVVGTVASAIAPLLVPDVPVFLWWKDIPHQEDKLFNRMSRLANRLVIDSAAFDHPREDLLRLAEVVRELRQETRVSDLNWGRLTSWRTLLASFWDVREYRAHLERIDRVTIEYDPPDAAPNEIAPKALMAACWLASRLQWELDPASIKHEGNTTSCAFAAPARSVTVEMKAMQDGEGCDGMLASLTLSAGEGDAVFSVALSRDGQRLETEVSIDGARMAGRVLSYEQKSEGQRLSRELGLLARDVIYEETLFLAAQLTEAIK